MTLPNRKSSHRNSRVNIRRRTEDDQADWMLSSTQNLDPGREQRLRAHRLERAERLRRREAQRVQALESLLKAQLLTGELRSGEG